MSATANVSTTDINAQRRTLKLLHDELLDMGVRITGIYMPSAITDGGLEISNKYVLQLAPYHTPHILLYMGRDVEDDYKEFNTSSELIKWLNNLL